MNPIKPQGDKKPADQSEIVDKVISEWLKGRIAKADPKYQCRECKKAPAVWKVNLFKSRYYCNEEPRPKGRGI